MINQMEECQGKAKDTLAIERVQELEVGFQQGLQGAMLDTSLHLRSD
jgi:hypothetical protein